jgi:ubiquitin-activating enzyme E1
MWAREQFHNFFEKDPSTLNRYLSDPNMIEELTRADPGELAQSLQILKCLLKDHPIHNYEDCVHWARQQFEDLFNYKIRDLLHSYPEDHVTKEGTPFWSGHRRAPTPLQYDPNNEYHAEFILQSSTIIARIYGIQPTGNPIQMAAQLDFPNWSPPNVQVQINADNQNQPREVITIETTLKLNQELIPFKNRSLVKPEVFEKDNETNGHIGFVAAASNLRALNYKIKPETQLEIKRIAGKIIPAISTTTAMICGLVTLEMFKIHSPEPKPLESYRSGFINLAISLYAISEPSPCPTIKCRANDIEYTMWDSWLFEGDLTVGELIQQAETKYNLSVEMMTFNTQILFTLFHSNDEKQKRFQRKISEMLVEGGEETALEEGKNLLSIVALCVDKDGKEIETPQFVLKVK